MTGSQLPKLFAAIVGAFVSASGVTTTTVAVAQSSGTLQLWDQEYPAEIFGNLSGQVVFWDTSGGAIIKADEETIFADFTKLTGVKVVSDYYCCDLSKLQAQIESGHVMWDLLSLINGADLALGIEKGYFAKLDPKIVPLDQMEPGGFNDYATRMQIYASTVAWNTNVFPSTGKQPTKLQDVYDTTNFPGKRCLMKIPDIAANFEAALLADGVSREALYPLDLDRAFRKMDTIKDITVWSDNGQQVVQNLISGECNIGITWSGRPYAAVESAGAPVAEAFGDAMLYSGWWAIAKGAPNEKNAQALLAMWIMNRHAQIEFVTRVPYPSAIKGLTDPNVYPEKVRPFLPNYQTGIVSDDNYYASHKDEITKRWDAWLAK